MYEWTASAYHWIADPAGASDSTNVKVALIAAVALVLAAAVPALLSTREREPHAAKELRLDLRAQRNRLQAKLDWNYKYVESLENLCWENHLDPRLVRPPEEPE